MGSAQPTRPVGDILMTGDQVEMAAGCPSGGVPMVGTQFMAGGFMLVGCWSNDPVYTAVINVETGGLAWKRQDPGNTQVFARGRFVYVFTPVEQTAGALSAAETHFTLECLDGASGTSRWKSPVEDWLPADKRDAGGEVELTEGDGQIPGHPSTVWVDRAGSTLFDADTGKELWHGDRSGATYDGYGILETETNNNTGGWHAVGTSLLTGRPVWSITKPDISGRGVQDGPVNVLVDTNRFFAYDVRTGKVLHSGTAPPTGNQLLFNTNWLLVDDKDTKSIKLYRFGSWNTPIWTIKADADAQLLVPGAAVLQGPRGVVLLNLREGSVAAEARDTGLAGVQSSVGAAPSYGLGLLGNGSVIQLDQDLTDQ